MKIFQFSGNKASDYNYRYMKENAQICDKIQFLLSIQNIPLLGRFHQNNVPNESLNLRTKSSLKLRWPE